MFDAPMGYHQLAIALASQEKLAFQGIDAIKWTYNVMPFEPTNGPAAFVNFIYNIDSVWKKLTTLRGVPVGDTTNTRIIIDNIVSWSSTKEYALEYIRCQLKVCQVYCLSLNLHKSRFFPKRFKFVGIDVCNDGNRPSKSKHTLLTTWPDLGRMANLRTRRQARLELVELKLQVLAEVRTSVVVDDPKWKL